MKIKLGNTMVAALVGAGLCGNILETVAQADDTADLKGLVLKKFDSNLDGELTGVERDGAVSFLRGVDRNGDSEISATEQAGAIEALKQMPDPKPVVPKPAKAPDTISSTMKNVRNPAGKEMKGGAAVIREGVIPNIVIGPKPTAESIAKKREELEEAQKMRDEQRRKRLEKTLAEKPPSKPAKPKNYYDGATIIAVSGVHTVVPQGAVIYVPPSLTEMIVKEPQGKLMRWPEFLEKHSKWLNTRKVSWETAKGEDPIKEEERKTFAEGEKIIVAVFGKNPITVLEPPPEPEKKEDTTVEGAVKSGGGKKDR
jgi:hypothetical protein